MTEHQPHSTSLRKYMTSQENTTTCLHGVQLLSGYCRFDEEYFNITVKPAIFVPSAFTITHDGLNEMFHVTYYYITEPE